jgi:hypothetical protein
MFSLCLLKTMQKYVKGVEIQLHAFLTSALDTSEWSASLPSRSTHRIGSSLDSRADLNAVREREYLTPCKEINPDSSVAHPIT